MSIAHMKLAGRLTRTSSKRLLCSICNGNMPSGTLFANKAHQVRLYSDKRDDPTEVKSEITALKGIASKYKIFQDFESPIILDVDEERELYQSNAEVLEEVVTREDPYSHMNLEHGKTGVYDVEELVTILKKENAQDIVVISVPPEKEYVDYMVIATGKSKKHTWALASFIRGLYKRRAYKNERPPQLEGQEIDSSWLAMDMENIALHIFTKGARRHYDIELLWSVGYKYDDLTNKKERNYIELLQEFTHPAMSGLTPVNEPFKPEPESTSVQGNLG